MEELVTLSSRTKIHKRDLQGERGTVILVHGLTGNHKQLRYFQNYLSKSYHTISYDIAGRGNSTTTEKSTSIFTHAEELIQFILRENITQPILFGYSMGAYICSIAASRMENVSAVILLDGGGAADKNTEDLVLPSLEKLKKFYPSKEAYIEETRIGQEKLGVVWDDDKVDIADYEVEETKQGWKHKSDYEQIKNDFLSFYDFNPEEYFPNIDCDILLFIAAGHISNDAPLFRKEGYAGLINSSNRIETEITDVNHYELVFNKQEKIFDLIGDFLAKRS